MLIKTSDLNSTVLNIKKLYIPDKNSHKGKNGKVLIIGGSKLFHAASIWAAESASHIVDIVHYSSTLENNEVMVSLKKKFIKKRKLKKILLIKKFYCLVEKGSTPGR